MTTLSRYCTFFLDDLFFGIEVTQVQEILRWQELTAVPLAPSLVKGLMNLRGQIVSVLDLRQRMGLAPLQNEQEGFNMLVHTTGGVTSFLVDRVGDVVEVSSADFEPPPETLQGPARELIRGAFKMEGALLLALVSEKVYETDVLAA